MMIMIMMVVIIFQTLFNVSNYLLRYGVLWSKELPFDCMSISNQHDINNNISLHKNYFKTVKKKEINPYSAMNINSVKINTTEKLYQI